MKRVTQLRPKQVYLAVHRRNFMVYYRRLDAKEYRLLCSLRDGHPIARAIRRAFADSSASTGEQRPMIEKWFAICAELGWLCPRPKSKKG
jgi:hypothetical protein